ncbi:hypothetical protein D3C81_1601390 [compost metagenome]
MNTANKLVLPNAPMSRNNNSLGCSSERTCFAKLIGSSSLILGMNMTIPINAIIPIIAIAPKEALHPICCPIKVPSGTPIMFAIVSPAIIIDTAPARLFGRTRLAAMTAPTPKKVPCVRDVTMRAPINTA